MDASKLKELGELRRRVAALEQELGVDSSARYLPDVAVDGLDPSVAHALAARYATDTISIHAANGVYLYASPACEALMGWTPDELIGRNPYTMFHPDDLARISESHASQSSGQEQRDRYRILCKDGSYRWVETFSRSHIDPTRATSDGQGAAVQQIICVTRDVELQVQAERTVLETNRKLEHFAGAVAHDLKSPLGIMTGYGGLLLSTAGDRLLPKERTHLERIIDVGFQLAAQIDELLDWSRQAQGARPHTPTALGDLVDEVLKTLSHQLEAAGAQVDVGELPTVLLDRPLGRVLVQNLVTNAVKYSRPGVAPRLAIVAERNTGWWDIQVRDNGRGVPAEDRVRIFKMFGRGKASGDGKGHGIGLALCSRIAELHGGRIWVEPAVPQGSVFHVRLPEQASA